MLTHAWCALFHISIGLLKETIGRLGKEKAKADSTRQELSQLCREKAQEKIRALKAMTER